jgi:hypothetical protein
LVKFLHTFLGAFFTIKFLLFFGVEDITLTYPFFYRPMYNMLEDGWSAFRPESEFSKLLVPGSNEEWRISYVNKDFMVKTHTAPQSSPFLKRPYNSRFAAVIPVPLSFQKA